MHVDVRGPAETTSILLLHGGTGAGHYHWRRILPHLEGRYRLHVADLPGHGSSPLEGDRYDLALLVDAVDSLVDDVGAPAHVAGFSMGAHAALHLATARPEAFSSLLLIGASIRNHDGLTGWRANFDPDRLEAEHPLWAKTLARMHEPLGGPEAWKDVARRDASGLVEPVDLQALAALECPVRLVRGDRDPAVDPGQYAELREALGERAEEAVVPAGGHEVQMTRAELTGPLVADFYDRSVG